MTAVVGVWLLASLALGRPAPVSERYPHVCGTVAPGWVPPHRPVRLRAKECAACPQLVGRPG
ncbi:hypothetical protein AB0873_14880 [Micromonospora sp. NPDC047707]|uniref:hypothetical protein n=1 Tax=Micromonospora sp. NPDC047707 TaxID=3154498 RepID=UPI0034573535